MPTTPVSVVSTLAVIPTFAPLIVVPVKPIGAPVVSRIAPSSSVSVPRSSQGVAAASSVDGAVTVTLYEVMPSAV